MLPTREAALAAVRQYGPASRHAVDREAAFGLQLAVLAFTADRGVVLAAVRHVGCALAFASEALRADPQVVLAAVHSDWEALALASPALRADPFLSRAARESRALARLPRLCRFLLARHRHEGAARVAAQADRWLIRHKQDGFARACKRQRAA
jgi:hypothetical protein